MTDRRRFLGRVLASSAMAGFPTIVKGSALGLNGAVAASDRVVLATIGCGGMGNGHIGHFLKIPAAQYVAVCDVDEDHLAAAKARIDTAYENSGCVTYRAIEEVLLRPDIDAVTIALPDHWHGIASVLALRQKKDVYGEKPLAHTFSEGLAIADAVRKNNRIWQTGSWQRSVANFHRACELVRNGRLGKVRAVEVGLPSGPFDYGKLKDQTQFVEPPPQLNYERWLGPGPEVPYWAGRCHGTWRWNLSFGGGQLMDWVGHHNDIAHWGLGFDETGPVSVEGQGEYPAREELWNSARRYKITAQYAEGVTSTIAGGVPEIRMGTRWIGENGHWIYVNRGKQLEAEPASLLESVIGPDEIHLSKGPSGTEHDHYLQFIECVKSRQETRTPARIALRSVTPGWLGQIAMLTGKRIQWDPHLQVIVDSSEASRMLSQEMREPYRL
ncbi:MAG: Gfo/Idh/MocA family oxidoreductase [Bryobacterales bacterium]|nr:Gfo/Idh/MocA family oxidoreductase [Bryobacterales bacterium]